MAFLITTTYRKDYVDFTKTASPSDRSVESAPAQLELLHCRAGATAAGRGRSEWTGIAPSACKFRTRIIPNAAGASGVPELLSKTEQCLRQRPNRFLLNLYNTHPGLWAVLARAAKDQAKTIGQNRMFSTYQVNYGGMAEYPNAVYDDVPDECCGRTPAETRGHWQAQDRRQE